MDPQARLQHFLASRHEYRRQCIGTETPYPGCAGRVNLLNQPAGAVSAVAFQETSLGCRADARPVFGKLRPGGRHEAGKCRDLGKIFDEAAGPRTGNAFHRSLHEMPMIALPCMVCGGQTCTDMEPFGRSMETFLRRFMKLDTASRATTPSRACSGVSILKAWPCPKARRCLRSVPPWRRTARETT